MSSHDHNDEEVVNSAAENAQASSALLQWLDGLKFHPQDPSPSENVRRYDDWTAYGVDALLNGYKTDLLRETAEFFRPIAQSTARRSRLKQYCILKIDLDYKEEFGELQWRPGMVRNVAIMQNLHGLKSSASGVYEIEADSAANSFQKVEVKIADSERKVTTELVCWGLYGGQTKVSFDAR